MRVSKTATALAAATGTVSAQRPTDVSICDYYTKALLKENTAENQATLLTLVVNTVVIGNYTEPNVGIKVPGILAPGEYMGTKVNLLPYFDGTLASSNRGGDAGVSVNFLDDGGAEPLMKNMPANGQDSEQYFLLTHLYQFFGSLLGCSQQGMPGFDPYTADKSMYDVHKFMGLEHAEVGYFITQVGLAAASFGVATDDVTFVGMVLDSIFNYRCAPETVVIKAQGPALQAICIADDCPLAVNATCGAYDAAVEPTTAITSSMMSASTMVPSNSTTMVATPTVHTSPMPTGTGSMTMSATMQPTTIPTAGAAANGLSLAALAGGIAAFLL